MTTLITLALDPASQARFEALRQQYFPPARNQIPAHVTLFHKLPDTADIAFPLRKAADRVKSFPVQVTGVRSLGRGVAYTLAAPELLSLHAGLSAKFAAHLSPQDRQRFAPHVVVQNKATATEAKELLLTLQASFTPSTVQAAGLLWWEYLGGPWRLLEAVGFAGQRITPTKEERPPSAGGLSSS